jgi:hypothetical protein
MIFNMVMGFKNESLAFTPVLSLINDQSRSLTFRITNNNNIPVMVFYEIGNSVPTEFNNIIQANSFIDFQVNDLEPDTSYTLYVYFESTVFPGFKTEVISRIGKTRIEGLQVLGSNTFVYPSNFPITYVSEIESISNVSILPTNRAFYLRYTLRKAGENQTITVSCRRNAGSGKISQSAFTFQGSSFGYSGGTQSIFFLNNDDHDTSGILPNGTGIVARQNTNNLNNSNGYDIGRGTTEISRGASTDSTFPFSPSSFISTSHSASYAAFFKTNSICYINFSTGQFRVNNGTPVSFGSGMNSHIGTGISPANNISIISDGVNSFRIYRYGQSSAIDIVVDLLNNTILSQTTVSFSASLTNSTEEDAFGDLLYTIDGSITYHSNVVFYYTLGSTTSGIGWRDATNYTSGSLTTITAGSLNTQTGMDIFYSIDNDRYVWFGDWGHDDGGLFNIGNDDRFNIRKTNIYHLTDNYVI